jgi:hypothetical protein
MSSLTEEVLLKMRKSKTYNEARLMEYKQLTRASISDIQLLFPPDRDKQEEEAFNETPVNFLNVSSKTKIDVNEVIINYFTKILKKGLRRYKLSFEIFEHNPEAFLWFLEIIYNEKLGVYKTKYEERFILGLQLFQKNNKASRTLDSPKAEGKEVQFENQVEDSTESEKVFRKVPLHLIFERINFTNEFNYNLSRKRRESLKYKRFRGIKKSQHKK